MAVAQSPIQQKFLDWYEAEKLKGLKEVRWFFSGYMNLHFDTNGDLQLGKTNGTVDEVLEEFFRAEEAIAAGNCTPIPDSF